MLGSMAALASMDCLPATHAADLARRALAGGRWEEWDAWAPAWTLLLADESVLPMGVLDAMLANSRARGDDWSHHQHLVNRALAQYQFGEVDEAAADAQVAVDICEQAPWRPTSSLPFALCACLSAEQGDADRATSLLARVSNDIGDIPYVLQYNKRDLPNVAPVEYMEFLLNNRDLQVPSFTSTAHKCEGVFETLNMITRMLLNKFISQGTPQYA